MPGGQRRQLPGHARRVDPGLHAARAHQAVGGGGRVEVTRLQGEAELEAAGAVHCQPVRAPGRSGHGWRSDPRRTGAGAAHGRRSPDRGSSPIETGRDAVELPLPGGEAQAPRRRAPPERRQGPRLDRQPHMLRITSHVRASARVAGAQAAPNYDARKICPYTLSP